MSGIDNIEKYFDLSKLKAPINELQAIALLSTGKEDLELKKHFINQIVSNTSEEDLDVCKNLDFYIYINRKKQNQFDSQYLQKVFKSVTYKLLDVPQNQDFYFHPEQVANFTEKQKLSYDFTYGQKSGPNYAFFKIMKDLKKYNTTLALESDCFMKPGWLHSLYNFTKYSNGFWVSGSQYMGTARCDTDPLKLLTEHINGGVCLYATGDDNFQRFLDLMRECLVDIVKQFPAYPYDYIIPIMIHNFIQSENKNVYHFGKYVEKYYCTNNLIANLSTNTDSLIDPEEIFRLYNYKILHKKPFKYQQFSKSK